MSKKRISKKKIFIFINKINIKIIIFNQFLLNTSIIFKLFFLISFIDLFLVNTKDNFISLFYSI